MEKLELVILRGLPGSGKTTKAKKEFPDHLHYESDHLFCDVNGNYRFDIRLRKSALKFVLRMADLALSNGESVVISDVFEKLSELKPYKKLANYHKAKLSIINCKTKSMVKAITLSEPNIILVEETNNGIIPEKPRPAITAPIKFIVRIAGKIKRTKPAILIIDKPINKFPDLNLYDKKKLTINLPMSIPIQNKDTIRLAL